jgi:hypothetical protein
MAFQAVRDMPGVCTPGYSMSSRLRGDQESRRTKPSQGQAITRCKQPRNVHPGPAGKRRPTMTAKRQPPSTPPKHTSARVAATSPPNSVASSAESRSVETDSHPSRRPFAANAPHATQGHTTTRPCTGHSHERLLRENSRWPSSNCTSPAASIDFRRFAAT